MKKLRICALLGATLMVLFLMAGSVFADDEDFAWNDLDTEGEVTTLALDEPQDASIPDVDTTLTYSFTPEENGIYIFSSDDVDDADEDHADTVARLFGPDADGYAQIGENDDGPQYNGHFSLAHYLTAGETYYLQVKVFETSLDMPFAVGVTKSPVESITFEPAQAYTVKEGTNGYYYSEEEKYYYDLPEFEIGDKLTVTMTGSDPVTYTLTDDEDLGYIFMSGEETIPTEDVVRDEDQEHTPWTVGDNNIYTIRYLGAEADVKVTVEPYKVTELSFIPKEEMTVVHERDGAWDENDAGEKYFYYSLPDPEEGDLLKITDDNGEEITYVYTLHGDTMRPGFYKYTGEDENGQFTYDDTPFISYWTIRKTSEQSTHPWELGNGEYNYFTITFNGVSQKIPVTVKGNPVEKIRFEFADPEKDHYEFTYHDLSQGRFTTNENDEEIFVYDITFSAGDKLYVTKAGSTEETVYVYDGSEDFVNPEDEEDKISENDIEILDYQELDPWNTGSMYTFDMKYSGRTTELKAIVNETDVLSIEYNPESPYTFIENDADSGNFSYDADDVEYFYYYVSAKDGDVLRVTTSEGTTDYTYNSEDGAYYSEDGAEISADEVVITDDQSTNHWYPDMECEFTVSYKGKSITVPVTIEASDDPAHEYDFEFVDPETAKDITVGSSDTVTIDPENLTSTYRFDCEKTGTYVFESYAADGSDLVDTVGRIMRDDEETGGYIEVDEDDYGQHDNYNFRIVFYAEDGMTYYLQSTVYTDQTSGSYTVSLTEHPVTEIRYEQAGSIERVQGKDGYYDEEAEHFVYPFSPHDGDRLVLTDNDGNETAYIYSSENDSFVNKDDPSDEIPFSDITITDDQSETEWGLGDHYYTGIYNDIEFDIPVSIIEGTDPVDPELEAAVAEANELLDRVSDLGEGDQFGERSMKAINDAADALSAVLQKEDKTVTEIRDAMAVVEAAIENGKSPAEEAKEDEDKQALIDAQNFYDSCQKYVDAKDTYTETTYSNFEKMLADLKTLIDTKANASSLQSQIDMVNQMIDELVTKEEQATIDRENARINAVLRARQALDEPEIKAAIEGEDLYTTDSYKGFKDAKAALDALIADTNALAEDIDESVTDLRAAFSKLVTKKSEEEAKEKEQAVTNATTAASEAAKLVASDYTEESFAPFKAALDELSALLADPDKATTAQLNDAVSKLTAAKDALVKAEAPVVEPAANTLKVTPSKKTFKLKAKSLKKKAKTLKPFKITGAQGTVSYKVSVKGKSKKYLKFKNGKLTVKKRTKKGKYVMTVKVTAAGNENYLPLTKSCKITVVVK